MWKRWINSQKRRGNMKVLLDANFLMIPNQFGVDIFEYLKDYEIATMSACIGELKKLAKKRGKDGLAARIALKLVKENKVEVIRVKEKADNAILNEALNNKYTVATNDKVLIKALKNNGIKVIRLKQKKYLSEE